MAEARGSAARAARALAAGLEGEVRPLSATRRVVARKMSESARTIPTVTLHRSAPMATLRERRRRLAHTAGSPPSIDAMIARAVAVTLGEFDLLNAVFDEDAMAVRVLPVRDIAVAVETDRGLTSVVLRAADELDDRELSAILLERVGRARAGRSRMDDLAGATFTITNLGAFGIDAFTPIIVPPQVAILGIGRFLPDERSAPATLSLTFDHRVVDGAYAARFLARLVEHLADDSAGESPTSRVPPPGGV
jgi:pyruvate/2-oxoglutarate dehydrogenase complex dihydrolipoamide acyltransferase (E2) component